MGRVSGCQNRDIEPEDVSVGLDGYGGHDDQLLLGAGGKGIVEFEDSPTRVYPLYANTASGKAHHLFCSYRRHTSFLTAPRLDLTISSHSLILLYFCLTL